MKNFFEATPDAAPDYLKEKAERIKSFEDDGEFIKSSIEWRTLALRRKYMNNFSWLGRPMIQLPADVMAMQELIWNIKPDLIIETGIAHGGSLIMSASMLQLIGCGDVVGIDVEIRPHNKNAIQNHPMANRIKLIEGSSISDVVINEVRKISADKEKVLVFLDSNHTHEHVLAELKAYSPLVSVGSYIVVFDTFVEDLPDNFIWENRPWGKGNNPRTAVWEWLTSNGNFMSDKSIESKLMTTSAPDGFLRRIS
jgi:cephalosporin hydroxylase